MIPLYGENSQAFFMNLSRSKIVDTKFEERIRTIGISQHKVVTIVEAFWKRKT